MIIAMKIKKLKVQKKMLNKTKNHVSKFQRIFF